MTKTKKVLLVIGLLLLGYIAFRYAWHYGTVAYFKHKCETYGGEFIHKTVDNVEGIYQMRLRDPRDYESRLMRADIPEEPWGHTNRDAQLPHITFVRRDGSRYRFLETTKLPDTERLTLITGIPKDITVTGEKYWRYSSPDVLGDEYYKVEQTSTLKSQYGFTWKEVRDSWDKVLGVWGGELIVVKVDDGEVLGIRRGYFYRNPFAGLLRWCPIRGFDPTYSFVSKVLRPARQTMEIHQ